MQKGEGEGAEEVGGEEAHSVREVMRDICKRGVIFCRPSWTLWRHSMRLFGISWRPIHFRNWSVVGV